MLRASELRQKYLDFFQSKGHVIIPSASLMPENDPSTLFNTAGMQPLIPYLMGEKHPAGQRITNVQKCLRTGDIESVGDNRHLTFFEMLGNWSLGDYFKKEAIEWSFEFLTDRKKGLGLDPKRIYVTVFRGENNIPRDEEAIAIWQEVLAKAGIQAEVAGSDGAITDGVRIIPLGVSDNFWIAGPTGPCGGDTEMFYDTRPRDGKISGKFTDLIDSYRLMEIWNNVFMEFNKRPDGKYIKLATTNVDTGMGVERTIVALNGLNNVFETELFLPIIKKIELLSGKKYLFSRPDLQNNGLNIIHSMRVIADHLRAATFIMGDDLGVVPSNIDQGYVVRKLIRRAVRHGRMIGINRHFTDQISSTVIDMMGKSYPELRRNKDFALANFRQEEEKFTKTLREGLKEFDHYLKKRHEQGEPKILRAKWAFYFYQTFGFPFELIKEVAAEKNIALENNFDLYFQSELREHQHLSRTAAAGKFKGGLGERSGLTIKYHTATHLLHEALRQVLGSHVEQKGSNITPERLRFDFVHQQKMTSEQIAKVEAMVNQIITARLPVICEEMSVDEAKGQGAIGLFVNKYGERVKCYTMGNFSKEICGGPHVTNTGELGHFKIIKEEASSAGVRRIKAVLTD